MNINTRMRINFLKPICRIVVVALAVLAFCVFLAAAGSAFYVSMQPQFFSATKK